METERLLHTRRHTVPSPGHGAALILVIQIDNFELFPQSGIIRHLRKLSCRYLVLIQVTAFIQH